MTMVFGWWGLHPYFFKKMLFFTAENSYVETMGVSDISKNKSISKDDYKSKQTM